MTKGILKRHSLSGVSVASTCSESSTSSTQDDTPRPKRVSFDGAEPAHVFQADEWDRSPAEVTLRLTYKDVVELRELNVSLVRTSPLMMERTPSRRPTRQRTPTPPSSHSDSPTRSSLELDSRPDDALPPSPSPVSGLPSPRLSPTYQYQSFASKALPPLLEDASSSPETSPSEQRGRGHVTSASDSYFTFHPAPAAAPPPGLPAPRLKGIPSTVLAPPSPLALSSPLRSRSPSPRPASRPVSPIPTYLHSSQRSSSPLLRSHGVSNSQKLSPFPTLSRRASVPEELALEGAKGVLQHSSPSKGSSSPSWRPLGHAGVHANSSSPALSSSKSAFSSPVPPPVGATGLQRKSVSLMGWELRRTGSGHGRRGFGLVRKGSTGA